MDIKKYLALFILIHFMGSSSLFAKVDEASLLAKSKSIGFTQNKGQIIDQHNNPNPAVLYLLNGNGLNVQLRKTGFSYDIYTSQRKTKAVLGMVEPTQKLPGKEIEPEEVSYHFHRIDVELAGANPSPQIIAEGKSSDYTNYYNVAHAPDGILDVHQYQKVIFKDIYPGIDIEYLLNEKGFKYNFVVHAGAKLSDIKLQYKGAPFKSHGQELTFNTSQGEFKEIIPASWLIKNGLNQTVQVDYNLLDKETIGFKTQEQISLFDLVVDPIPDRLWGTYYGGSVQEYGRALCSDPSGNVYLAGFTNSINNISTTGSNQASFGGGTYDAFLIKFNTNGVRQWGSYYGGNSDEYVGALCSDPSGNVYLGGNTNSTTNISTTGSHQASWGGGTDAFIVKFNTIGVRQWGTYYGGSNDEYGNALCSDPSGNVYSGGYTSSTNNISTIGSHQASFGGGYDAFLVKFNTNGLRQWGTYYGGSLFDDGLALCSDPSGNVYLSGSASSTNNISTTSSHQASWGGGFGVDAFLVKFNTNGQRQWGTYYGGSDYDYGNTLCSDPSGNVYLGGQTSSTNNISTTGSHQASFGGSGDAFLVKFNTNGLRQWGTYYGGGSGDIGNALCSDANGNAYLAGLTVSTNNISTTGSYMVSFGGGNSDAFIVKFNANGVRLWGTYYGGSSVDYGRALCSDPFGNIYLGGETHSTTNFSTTGSHQASLGGNNDAFIVKFLDCTPLGNIGTINNPSTTYCQNTNYTFTLSTTTANANGYMWSVPAGWVIVSGNNTNSITVRPSGSGTISVKAYNNCGDSTTAATRSITVITSPAQPSAISTTQGQDINGIRTLCNGSSATFAVTNVTGITYLWTFPGGWSGSGTTNSTTRTVGLNSDTIRVIAQNSSGCQSIPRTRYVQVFTTPSIPTSILGPAQACRTGVNLYSVDSSNYATAYNWTVPSGWTILSGAGTRNIQVTAGTGSGNITVNASNFCSTSGQRTLAVTSAAAPAQPSTITGQTTICAGSNNVSYSVTSVSGVQYRWVLPANWQIVSGDNTNQITVNILDNASSGTIQVFPRLNSNTQCEGTARTLTVSVISFGSVGSISGSSNVCSGSSTVYSIPGISGATSYLWTLPSGWSGNSTSFNMNTTVGSSTGNVSLSVRGINGSCSSAVAQLPITVYGQIGQPDAISGNTSFCGNSQQNFSVANVANATSYIWTLPSGWSFNGIQNTNNISTTVVNNAGNFNLSVQAINPGCTSIVRTQAITVNASPQILSSISGIVNTCEGSTQTYTVSASNATSYTWNFPSGWSGTSTTNSINVTFNGLADTLRVVANGVGGCNSVQQKRFINVQATPAQPEIFGLTLGCASQYETFRINKIPTATSYTWRIPSGWDMSPSNGITSDTAMLIRPTNGVAGSIFVKATSSNGCSGLEKELSVPIVSTVIPSSPTTISGGSSFCEGVSTSYTIQAVSGATGYNWTVPSGWQISSGQNTVSLNVIPGSSTGNVRVQAIQGGCRSTFTNLSVSQRLNVPEQPLSITPSTQPICEQSTISLGVNNVNGATSYVWQLPGDWSIIGNQNLQTIQVQIGSMDGNVIVRGKNEGCVSDLSLNTPFTLSKLPQFVGGIAGEKYVKTNSIRRYSIIASNAVSYVWSLPSDWLLLSGENTNEITVLTGTQNATLSVSAINACGSKQTSMDVITGVSASLNEEAAFKKLQVYPNPVSSFLGISYELSRQDNIQFRLISLTGQTLKQDNLINFKGVEIINVEGLSEGMYMLQFLTSNQEPITTLKIQIIK